jgi:hypothetical protein
MGGAAYRSAVAGGNAWHCWAKGGATSAGMQEFWKEKATIYVKPALIMAKLWVRQDSLGLSGASSSGIPAARPR